MSTDFQHARQALGARLHEMRTEAELTTRQLAERCGWAHSKVSKLENGRQTATPADLESWSRATGHLDDLAELHGRLRGLETTYRSWRRQLAAGHRAVQELNVAQEREAEHIRLFEPAIIPGIFQTPEYARCVLTDVSERHGKARDIEAGVRARMRRQDVLYEPGHSIEAVIWEAALYVARCAPADMAAQLDRLVVADTWNAEMWLDTAEDIDLYEKVWNGLTDVAVYGTDARRLIARSRASIDLA
ncbi:Scr1 family TA system antitoxin-like transcriptional regulator [Streptomyces albus]|uniref:Scr1 family TA system antitoxin-like transcriptional regulator n=1 Tax=Streptomyces albus TaxID=1888 RepID=UPI0006E3EA0F|nr:Scr1 family TA system antitoxin-like transcriptional regulator [Streptomyces albus]